MRRVSIIGVLLAAAVVSAQQPADQAVKDMRAASGLEVTLWASEPSFSNPTNMAIDERGRVWVLEASITAARSEASRTSVPKGIASSFWRTRTETASPTRSRSRSEP